MSYARPNKAPAPNRRPRSPLGGFLCCSNVIAVSLLFPACPIRVIHPWFEANESDIFSKTGANFATSRNLFEVLRLSTEIGLLALVMTPIILTGGIDLSVGSLLGLCAILFGKFWRDAGMPPALAALCTLMVGTVCGGLNAWFITRLKLPPLIVTLGSFSLF